MVPIPTEILEDERAAERPAHLPFRYDGAIFIKEIHINDKYIHVFPQTAFHF